MGDAQRRQMMNIEALRQVVAAGPPEQPGKDKPGPVLAATREMLEALGHGVEVTPEEMIEGFAHLFDMNAWRGQMQQFDQMKALLEQAERRVVVAR